MPAGETSGDVDGTHRSTVSAPIVRVSCIWYPGRGAACGCGAGFAVAHAPSSSATTEAAAIALRVTTPGTP
jgi:hypothetical protein